MQEKWQLENGESTDISMIQEYDPDEVLWCQIEIVRETILLNDD